MVKTTVGLWTALATVLLIGGSSLGQSSGSITGTVKDSNGGAIAGAAVTLTNPAKSVTQSATTNDAGIFVSAQLPPGSYVVRVSKPGFRLLEQTDVILSTGDKLNPATLCLRLVRSRSGSDTGGCRPAADQDRVGRAV